MGFLKCTDSVPNVLNLIKFGRVAHYNQLHERLKYVLSAGIPFTWTDEEISFSLFLVILLQYRSLIKSETFSNNHTLTIYNFMKL